MLKRPLGLKARSMKGVAAVLTCVSALLAGAPPAAAEPTLAQDDHFYSTLLAMNFVVTNPPVVRSQAFMICNEGLGHGVPWREMRAQLMNWGYLPQEAAILGVAAIRSYCPEYNSLADALARDAS